jgi:hypothetical protein
MLRGDLAEAGVQIGRDRFFEVLREKSLVLERLMGVPKTKLGVYNSLCKYQKHGRNTEGVTHDYGKDTEEA